MYLISSCLCGVNCKYSGSNNLNKNCLDLLKEGKAVLVCPEQLGGLSTPRTPAEIKGTAKGVIYENDKVITKDGVDVTEAFIKGAMETLHIAKLSNVKAAILKEGSPSCGVNYIYDGSFTGNKVYGKGITASILEENGIEVISDVDFGGKKMGIFNFLRKVKQNENNEDNAREKIEIIDDNKKDNYSEIKLDISNLKKEIEDNFEEKEENIEKVKLTQEEIDELISSEILRIIDLYDNFEDVKSAAYEAAENIGKENIKDIPKFLSGKMHRPTRYINKYIDDQDWAVAVENSILMIIYSFKKEAVPVLERISQKNTKLNLKATNLLCKLASEGVETDEIVNWIMNNLMAFNDENKITILGFMSQIKGNNQVIGLIQHFYKSFVKNGEIEYAYRTLNHLINAAEKFTQGHLKFLKAIAMNKSTINLEEIMMLEESDPKVISLHKIEDRLSIDAAITYFALDKNDDDINSKLYYLSEYSLDKNLRENLKVLLKG